MNDDLTLTRPTIESRSDFRWLVRMQSDERRCQELGQMLRAFHQTGGIGEGDQVAQRLTRHCDQPISTVAHWIVDRQALAFAWAGRTMLPFFQFDLVCMTLRPNMRAVLRELSDVFDDWGCALWFAEANPWLSDRIPADVFAADSEAVLEAARVDRFIARG